ncbi:hypothetical protein [Tetragenococcus halophilus]|uniref:Uncharacterized protein n=1 Tax=Tetragenococcus halophilus TaxID=51669 RepID=A0AB35HRE1_TETHA|nr:hypothetical protein [Tetragenococcus halophilus]MCO8298663.1 hypothetical protein [Tetragenococcus halophilus]
MSELLEEARERRDKAELSTESPSYNWLNDSYYLGEQNAWQEAVELIEKHEKPKGLIDLVDPMATVARHKQCKYCHEPHEYIFIYEENKPNPDILRVFIGADNCLHIQQKDYSFADPNIKYCPMCGRDLKEVEE